MGGLSALLGITAVGLCHPEKPVLPWVRPAAFNTDAPATLRPSSLPARDVCAHGATNMSSWTDAAMLARATWLDNSKKAL
jgi:hypothetical protein